MDLRWKWVNWIYKRTNEPEPEFLKVSDATKNIKFLQPTLSEGIRESLSTKHFTATKFKMSPLSS